jgi:chromosome segregation ATPase
MTTAGAAMTTAGLVENLVKRLTATQDDWPASLIALELEAATLITAQAARIEELSGSVEFWMAQVDNGKDRVSELGQQLTAAEARIEELERLTREQDADYGLIIKPVRERAEKAEAEVERLSKINLNLCNSHNTLLIDGSQWQDRATASEARIEELKSENTDLGNEIHSLIDARTAAEAECLRLKEALANVKTAILSPDNELSVVCTVWMHDSPAETVVDYIDAAMSRSALQQGER